MVVGKLSMHRDGFGFVIPDPASLEDALKSQLSRDIFIPPPAVGSAMHGDLVLVEVGNIRPDGRAEGRIVRPVNRAHATVVGIFHYGQRRNYVTPIDQKISQEIIIPPGLEHPQLRSPLCPLCPLWFVQSPNSKATSKSRSSSRAGRRSCPPRRLGRSRKRRGRRRNHRLAERHAKSARQGRRDLGYEDDFGVDVEIIIRKFHLPHHFPPEVLAEAQRVEAVIPASRRPARGATFASSPS